MEKTIKITEEPIDPTVHCGQTISGAVLSFLGVVRERNEGKAVIAIDYQCYEAMALVEMERIVSAVEQKVPMQAVTVVHRTGLVKIGEPSLLVTVETAHRAESFEAVRSIVEAFKNDIPIWKKEQYADGSSKWL